MSICSRAAVIAASFFVLAGLPQAADEHIVATDILPGHWGVFLGEAFRSVDVIGFILITLLVILLGMCADLFSHLRIGKLIPEGLLADVQVEMANGEYEKALEISEKSNCLMGQIFAAPLSKTDYSYERMEEAMRGEVEIQGLVWRQWIGQFRIMAIAGFLLGIVGALIESMRFVADFAGRNDIGLALASSFEMRALVYNIFTALLLGALMALLALAAASTASSKLEKILLESRRLGEELLDPFRPLPLTQEE